MPTTLKRKGIFAEMRNYNFGRDLLTDNDGLTALKQGLIYGRESVLAERPLHEVVSEILAQARADAEENVIQGNEFCIYADKDEFYLGVVASVIVARKTEL